jgi:regulator of sirC expression with transglutaminase-like and TPR domain
MGTNKAEEIKSVLTNDFGYDFESEFFTDEIKTLVDEVIEVTNNSSQSEIDELTKEVERLKVLNKRLFTLWESLYSPNKLII